MGVASSGLSLRAIGVQGQRGLGIRVWGLAFSEVSIHEGQAMSPINDGPCKAISDAPTPKTRAIGLSLWGLIC